MASGKAITLARFYREMMDKWDENNKRWKEQFKFNKQMLAMWKQQFIFNKKQDQFNRAILKRIDNIVKKNKLKE